MGAFLCVLSTSNPVTTGYRWPGNASQDAIPPNAPPGFFYRPSAAPPSRSISTIIRQAEDGLGEGAGGPAAPAVAVADVAGVVGVAAVVAVGEAPVRQVALDDGALRAVRAVGVSLKQISIGT